MANTKISALTSATTPLAGTEVLPIVQTGATVKVATNDLTVRNIRANATTGILQITGPAAASTRVATVPDANWTAARTDAAQSFTGDQTLSTGNLIIGTSGKGIDFSATPGTGTSELFDDYEEGEWTCAVVGQTATRTGYYTKIGNVVHVTVDFACDTNATGTTSSSPISGLPFSASPSQVLSMWVRSADAVSGGGSAPTLTAGSPVVVQTSGTSLVIRPTASTQVNPYYFEDIFNSGSQFIITGSYRV
jgi:hypothetical protein